MVFKVFRLWPINGFLELHIVLFLNLDFFFPFLFVGLGGMRLCI
uniref:Uncharacterized protein n=1 Tax=Rhizophora mucronata TaxID=61149 RepID=A0A2P2LZG4_RHIMU